jgi:hypothetical protein
MYKNAGAQGGFVEFFFANNPLKEKKLKCWYEYLLSRMEASRGNPHLFVGIFGP